MRAIIISGGKIEDAFALEWMKNHPYDLLVAADSGMEFLYRNQMMPDVIAGDFDSVEKDAYEYFAGKEVSAEQDKKPEILRLNPVKDDTDTEFVIREAIRRGATAISILGGTGTRMDHVLGNVHLLGIGVEAGVEIEIVDAHNRIRMVSRELVISREAQFGEYISVLPFGGDAKGVTLEGFRYPLEDVVLKSFSSLGISNEIVEEQAIVKVADGVLLVIEARD